MKKLEEYANDLPEWSYRQSNFANVFFKVIWGHPSPNWGHLGSKHKNFQHRRIVYIQIMLLHFWFGKNLPRYSSEFRNIKKILGASDPFSWALREEGHACGWVLLPNSPRKTLFARAPFSRSSNEPVGLHSPKNRFDQLGPGVGIGLGRPTQRFSIQPKSLMLNPKAETPNFQKLEPKTPKRFCDIDPKPSSKSRVFASGQKKTNPVLIPGIKGINTSIFSIIIHFPDLGWNLYIQIVQLMKKICETLPLDKNPNQSYRGDGDSPIMFTNSTVY